MRPDDGRVTLWPIGVVGVIAILVVASVTPVMRLNSAPPPEFLNLQTGRGANPSQAKAYWETAAQVIQLRYRHIDILPEQVPDDFTPGTEQYESAQDQAARAIYWAKLRQEWSRADNWHKTLDFNASWILNDAASVAHGLHDFFIDHT